MFNSIVFKKFALTVDISNRKYDSSYVNSDYSLWQGKFKLKYLLSNKINLSGDYSIVDSKLGMNNGVDVDSILKTTSDYKTVFYENVGTPVLSPFLRQNVKQHNFRVGMLGKFLDSSLTKLNFYYRFGLNEMNHESLNIKDQYKDYTYGLNLNQNYSNEYVDAKLRINFEKNAMQLMEYSPNLDFYGKINSSHFSIAPIISFPLLSRKLILSLYYKHVNELYESVIFSSVRKNWNGFGLDLTYNYLNNYKFYIGYSSYEFFYKTKYHLFEIGTEMKCPLLYLNFRIFKRDQIKSYYKMFTIFSSDPQLYISEPMTGFNLIGNFNLEPLLIETQTSYSFNQDKSSSDLLSRIPKINFTGGIYYWYRCYYFLFYTFILAC